MRRPLRALLLAVAVVLGVHLVGGASASAAISVYNEPTYTKTSGNNAFWYRWTAVTGSDENGNTRYDWYLCFRTYHTYPNGSQIEEETSSGTNGPGTQNCTTSLRSGPSPAQADYAAMPYNGTSTVLQDGHRYDLCASGFYKWPFLWKWDQSSACPWTIIDRNKPQITVALAGGAAYAPSTAVPVTIGYSDATSPPWAGSGGVASNWVCFGSSACTPGGQPSTACSSPADPTSRTTSFACTLNVGGDGRWYVCAMAADGAVPDNTTGPNQFANATSNNANLSTTVCDDVTVDRAPPTVTASASTPTIAAGQPVSFTATASDATSGVAGPYEWDFGDGIGSSGSGNPTHAYAQPGTYVARVSTRDGAGNQGTATVTITVTGGGGGGTPTTPTTPTGPTDPGTPGGGSPGGGSSGGGGAPGGGSSSGGGTNPTGAAGGGAATVISAPSTSAVGRDNGGGATQQLQAGGLRLIAPKRFVLTPKRRTLRLRAVLSAPGTTTVMLARGGKRVARGTVKAKRAGTVGVALKLPTSLRAGRYTLTAAFTPAKGKRVTRKATITVRRAASRARPLTGIPLAG